MGKPDRLSSSHHDEASEQPCIYRVTCMHLRVYLNSVYLFHIT